MRKKKQSNKLRYESEKSYRWGMCMKLAKLVYRSEQPTYAIEQDLERIEQSFVIDKK